MGIYLNPGNIDFQEALNSKIYVDKTELLKYTNDVIRTEDKYVCVSRPRRFGKSMAANMLVAYYSRSCDSKDMFEKYKIAGDESFEKHLNKYNVIHINMVNFIKRKRSVSDSLEYLDQRLLHELKKEFGDVDCFDWTDIISVLGEIFNDKKVPFIFIIDEWDCVFRIFKNNEEEQTDYLDYLRNLLKNQKYVALAYMTGILPIKKYGEHSALNMFTEIAMTNAAPLEEFTGFTENEVNDLCNEYEKDYSEIKRWYDGYNVDGTAIYNPKSVVEAMNRGNIRNYWTSTETYEALKIYIQMNYDGLKEKVTNMISGEKAKVNIGKFQNDMTSFNSADDVLTNGEVWIPNSEVQQEFINSIEDGGWEEVMDAINASSKLLDLTLRGDEEKVAEMIAKVHSDNTSILKYNDENSLSCVISLAYYSARKDYIIHRELATGNGFADLVFIPRKGRNMPAMIVELKKGHSADEAIQQIKDNDYLHKVSEYSGEMLLVGINYNEQKGHTCKIEKIQK